MKYLRLGAAALSILLSVSACSLFTRHPLWPAAVQACRASGDEAAVNWIRPDDAGNRSRLDSFCAAVGPVLFQSLAPNQPLARPDPREIAFVSWNLHVGAGDIERFVMDLRSGRLTDGRKPTEIVLMLQEAVRSEGVPAALPDGASSARRIGSAGGPGDHHEIEAIARRLGMSVFYAPSIRNGSPSGRYHSTDRGNAILSTLPLSAPAAIELPGDRQRRVAITAAVPVRIGEQDVDLAIGSAHLDVMGQSRTLWLFGASSLRGEQAVALTRALPENGPTVLGADLNTWLGSSEPAPQALARFFPDTPQEKRPGTFLGGLVLDYMFFRAPSGLRARFDRVPDKYGSDHYPLVGWLNPDQNVSAKGAQKSSSALE
jgi:endonuclease/exonuclease/phosphatase family metal-dependent hydrolase